MGDGGRAWTTPWVYGPKGTGSSYARRRTRAETRMETFRIVSRNISVDKRAYAIGAEWSVWRADRRRTSTPATFIAVPAAAIRPAYQYGESSAGPPRREERATAIGDRSDRFLRSRASFD